MVREFLGRLYISTKINKTIKIFFFSFLVHFSQTTDNILVINCYFYYIYCCQFFLWLILCGGFDFELFVNMTFRLLSLWSIFFSNHETNSWLWYLVRKLQIRRFLNNLPHRLIKLFFIFLYHFSGRSCKTILFFLTFLSLSLKRVQIVRKRRPL